MNEFYNKLVDMYAGRELTDGLNEEMEEAGAENAALGREMATLRATVNLLSNDNGPEFTEESYQRILMKLYARGAAIQPKAPAPMHLQYHLPIMG